jgi:hypothetical protein
MPAVTVVNKDNETLWDPILDLILLNIHLKLYFDTIIVE